MTISTSIQLTSVFRRKEKLIQFLDFFFFFSSSPTTSALCMFYSQ